MTEQGKRRSKEKSNDALRFQIVTLQNCFYKYLNYLCIIKKKKNLYITIQRAQVVQEDNKSANANENFPMRRMYTKTLNKKSLSAQMPKQARLRDIII